MHVADVMTRRRTAPGRTTLLVVLALVVGALALAGPAAATAPSVVDLDSLETAILKKVNEVRRAAGLTALRPASSLDRAAASYARAMAVQGFFSHVPPSGVSLKTRLSGFYPPTNPARWRIGEVMLWRSAATEAEDVVTTWMNSPPHRTVLLLPAFREIGIGAVHVTNAPSVFGGESATIVVSDLGAGG